MEFASANFIFFFLPAVFLLHLLIPSRWQKVRNWLLILASLVFYAWGNIYYTLLLLASSVINFFLAFSKKKALLVISVVFNIGMLFVFKYADFLIGTFNGVFGSSIPLIGIASPIGISFFTFQALSYVIDSHRGSIKPTKDLSKFLLYISFFAQLVQGPIIRWSEMEDQLGERKKDASGIAAGLRLFIIGLSMKLIIANTLGRVSGFVYALDKSELNIAYAWIGAAAFLLQLYFDFAGYSTMAVGLGAMFGFDIPRNFNYPYIAYSMTDFWRRWHITLSRWFRDYVYIPLGGNRKGAFRTGLNKVIVFLLTGLWHGANWTFVVWGAYNGAFLLGESFIKRTKFRLPKPVTWLYTIIAVTVGFAIFNSPDISYALAMIRNMFAGFSVSADTLAQLSKLFKPTVTAVSVIAVPAAAPIGKLVLRKLENKPVLHTVLSYGTALLLLVLCLFFVASGNYNPSIYTKF